MSGYYEQLKNRIEELKSTSKDLFFTDYLCKLEKQLQAQKQQMDLISADLERSYQIYLQRNSDVIPEQKNVQQPISQPVPQQVSQPIPQPAPQPAPQPTPRKPKKDKEFVVGIGVFSVIGVFFVLTAFVMLGMYFMTGFLKGMLLYVIALVVWALSELFVRKRSQTLSLIFSSIGIGGLYIATMTNFLYLQNFNEIVTGIVLAGITLLVFGVNRKKELGMIQMAAVAISTWVFAINCNESIIDVSENSFNIFMTIYLVASMLLLELILCRMCRKEGHNIGLVTTFGISMGICVLSCFSCLDADISVYTILRIIIVVSSVLLGMLAFWMVRTSPVRWTQVYYAVIVSLLMCSSPLDFTIALLTSLLVVKLLNDEKYLRVCDISLTLLTALCSLIFVDEIYRYILLAGLLLSILFIRYWKTCYEIIVTVTTVLFIFINMDNILESSVVIAVLWLAVVLFNQIERFRDKWIDIFNLIVLVMLSGCYLALLADPYEDIRILYLIPTVLGLGIIAFIFQEKNHWWPAKGLVVSGFLTYMVLVVRFDMDIITSIVLMLVGLGSIGFGFAGKDKKQRIYGLVLSMLVCFKITLFDFQGEDMLQKMLLFLVAGIVALIISGIYTILEKNISK